MSAGALTGKVAVVATGAGPAPEAVARRLAAEGAAVVLVAEAGEEEVVAGAARLAGELQDTGSGRTAVFTLTGTEATDLDALIEFLGELFR